MRLKKILVVDDNEPDLYLSKETIREFDPSIEVFEAIHGQDALDKLAANIFQPDLILLDISMPVMNGHEFLAAYSQTIHQTSTIIMLTHSSQQRDIDNASRYDRVLDYLVKPITMEYLTKLSQAEGLCGNAKGI